MTSELRTSSVPGSQVTTNDVELAQPGAESPSEAVAVSVTGPGWLQTNVGVAEVGLLKDPEPAVQEYASGEGPLSESCAAIASATGKPTAMSAGLAEMPSMTGQMLSLPVTPTLPVFGDSWHSRLTLTMAMV